MFKIRFTAFVLIVIFSKILHSQDSKSISWKAAQGQNQEWYSSTEAQRIADNVLLYQNNNGGWLKNIDMGGVLTESEKETLQKEKEQQIGTTIDNGATHSQLQFLAKVYNQTQIKKYKQAFIKGIDYLLEAQYENGGWPQYYPLREGYYQHITFNDNAMIGVMNLLRDIALEQEKYRFVDEKRRKRTEEAVKKGVEVILAMQVHIDGKPTVWCAQHHSKDLSPAKARAYELPSLSGAESVKIVEYLMKIENPNKEVIEAVKSAVSWFEEHKIMGEKVITEKAPSLPGGKDRVVIKDPKSGPLWARFNEIGTGRPIFVGRDGRPRNKLSEIEHERRVGYSYLGNYAEKLLEKDYPQWVKPLQ